MSTAARIKFLNLQIKNGLNASLDEAKNRLYIVELLRDNSKAMPFRIKSGIQSTKFWIPACTGMTGTFHFKLEL